MDERFRVSPRARRDLFEIWQYTCDEWGKEQADRYLRQINTSFGAIADNPEMYRERTEIVPAMRLCRVGSHVVIFHSPSDRVEIIRVVHGRRNWASLFADADD